ncbi:MAG: hypothetical protein B7Z75_03890 [Acidocella sp. 20-57-95]|nr:MAG: hypothetical protein B7Z75_03890 [Acidocella sp. 20-57-95]OYV60275.1 MAG: hypothetical protein B7Z71_06525 [Acidocella sp. 21-58-7]HQT63931.1 hypothetical protein [Acidocella sp.]HQU03648.1 hypothetical protein [Acidocella sp.]
MRILCLLLLLAGCAASPPITRIVTLTPPIPASLLHCAAAPDVPDATSQMVVARYIVALWQAGQDCRVHVAAIAQVAAK